eukprot:TRINITY_DN29121_c0_g1_i1.p1 TRINITY_DN29121_c0_g1~~TRINITY_DN29121_c0_g1_i1.p1  ORF type:complete len:1577 (+),score=242.18 TRINITY_DN29121_c0_g1_i1:81-4811(+)
MSMSKASRPCAMYEPLNYRSLPTRAPQTSSRPNQTQSPGRQSLIRSLELAPASKPASNRVPVSWASASSAQSSSAAPATPSAAGRSLASPNSPEVRPRPSTKSKATPPTSPLQRSRSQTQTTPTSKAVSSPSQRTRESRSPQPTGPITSGTASNVQSPPKRFFACGERDEVYFALNQVLSCMAEADAALFQVLRESGQTNGSRNADFGNGDASKKTVTEVRQFISAASEYNGRFIQQITDTGHALRFLGNENDRLHAEVARLEGEKVQSAKTLAECQAECERKIAEMQLEMTTQAGTFFAECGRTMEANKAEMMKRVSEFAAEKERFETERVAMAKDMESFRTKLAAEEEEMKTKISRLHEECELKVTEQKLAADRRVAEGRLQTEEQLRMERQVTNHIMHVLRELPPLQSAMELGDLRLLEEELQKWKGDELPERFGECKGVVQAVLGLARERLAVWRDLERTWKEVLREVERVPAKSTSLAVLSQQGQRVFRVLKEAQLTRMDLQRSDPEAAESIRKVLLAWQERVTAYSNNVQGLIIRRVVNCPQLGPFDFADLDICLHLVDRVESRNDVFLLRAQALIEDKNTAPKDFRSLLTHLGTMLFFLKYIKYEDLKLTYTEFQRQLRSNAGLDSAVVEYLRSAERVYPPGSELVKLSNDKDLTDRKIIDSVLKQLRKPACSGYIPSFIAGQDSLGPFREIFYQWAVAVRNKFNLLVLPHHTQVVCMLMFRCFLESGKSSRTPHTLIAQVGTGEGKSMIVAALAVYVVLVLRKKAHVVVDDDTLLERDFSTFKCVFDAFQIEMPNSRQRPLSAVLCVSEEQLASRGKEPFLSTRVDPDADICYCEAKHVQSFYASIARGQNCDFSGFDDCVLILDEVDALVIDEEPNEVFVYPNEELSEMATSVASILASGSSKEKLSTLQASTQHPAAPRVIAEMVKEWAHGERLVAGQDFVYSKEAGRNLMLQAGRANPKSWSLALECRNFQDGLMPRILFQERLFVMSRPRVFRRYHRILGLSGSPGSSPERQFLADTYRAAFVSVPPFLKTCKGCAFREATPARLGSQQRAVYVEGSSEAQFRRVAEVVLEARKRVPVLVIARDRAQVDDIVTYLREVASSLSFGVGVAEDIIRSLSRNLYESDPEQWKENLNKSTLPVGDRNNQSGTTKHWRVTVTDPRGGRGTDYRVDDPHVDAEGGLLLVPTVVPSSRREWTQFLGRTARQDCRGQFCCILAAADYDALIKKHRQQLPVVGGLDVVETLLGWGDKEVAEKLKASAALYNCGVRANELCEEVFGSRPELLQDPRARECLVEVCQRLRWLSVHEINNAFKRLPGFDPALVATEAKDLGRPVELHGTVAVNGIGLSQLSMVPPKIIIFCLDVSASMMSRDTKTPLTRFETCVSRMRRILHEQIRDCDWVGIVVFGPSVQVVVPLTLKGQAGNLFESRLAGLRPQIAGGTCFFDAVAHCLQLISQPGLQIPSVAKRWLVCLTDGDDLGSRPQNSQGQWVSNMLDASPPANFSLVIITVGVLKRINANIIDSWVQKVCARNGLGKHLCEKDAATIARAFDVVAECLAAEVGGATEC